ncbi:unnamed protein product [Brachionus calyciflorus]|uniref:Uncharacterized protein n=1 Tax=Brachionus calyciflorus TaxID=104777 RepID=A0A813NUC2_9BILA|nr:unnamed protein product [Brachionus calyciflorus]
MIRKLKNILNHKENAQPAPYDIQTNSLANSNNNKNNPASPVSFIKKKIKSTKSWVKLPKSARIFQEIDGTYESVSSMEPANHEFESYTRVKKLENLDKVTKSPLLKHSTLNSKVENEFFYGDSLHSKIIEKLGKSSIETPANIPILCINSFNLNDPKWVQLKSKFSSCGLNVRLIELQKGVPVNAMFYLSNLDLIYVKTADDLEGYVPRDCCKPITCSNEINPKKITIPNKVGFRPLKSISSDTDTLNTNSNNYSDEKSNVNDSIKYHSLSIESEYDDLIESNNNNNEEENMRPTKIKSNLPSYHFDNNNSNFSVLNPDYSLCKYRDSGYRSEIENNITNFSSNYKILDENFDNFDTKTSKCLLSMQSRSRLPISIKSNLNLTLMDDQNFLPCDMQNDFCYDHKNSFLNQANFRMSARQPRYKKNEFKRSNIRRSLDSYLTSQNDTGRLPAAFYAVSIDLDDENKEKNLEINSSDLMYYPDLDLNKIELDSLNDISMQKSQQQDKIWTIILKHDARNFQEISVSPGMLVLVIKEFNEMLYVKLIGYENSSLKLSQQYGMIPKNCAVDLQEIIYRSNKNLNMFDQQQIHNNNNNNNNNNRRKSQITALLYEAFELILDNKSKLLDKLNNQEIPNSNNNNLLLVGGRRGPGRATRNRGRGRTCRGRGRGRGVVIQAEDQLIQEISDEHGSELCLLIENFVAYFVDTWFERVFEYEINMKINMKSFNIFKS